MTAILLAAVLTAVGTVAGVALYRRGAVRWGLLDVPNDRSLHAAPVPRGAGVVIGTLVIAALVILGALEKAGPPPLAAVFAVATLAILMLGWMDDRWSLPAKHRLGAQVAVAIFVVWACGWYRVMALPLLPPLRLDGIGLVLTVIWIVGLVNAYNFMDGIDGIAAGQAVITASCWIAAGVLLESTFTIAAASVITASSAAFLVHNWSPARVFLGDAGSNFLGLSFAMFPLALEDGAASERLPLAAILFVGVFLIDTVFTFSRRLLRGENVLQAHRTHLYQRLIACGYSHATVAAWWLVLGAASGAAGLLYLSGGWSLAVAATAGAVAAAVFGSVHLAEARCSTGIV